MTSSCPTSENPTAARNIRFVKRPIVNTLLVCERQLSAFHMSNKTKQVNVIVVSRAVRPSDPSAISRWNTQSVPRMIIPADSNTLITNDLEIMAFFTFLGRCLSTSWSTGSTPNDCAGGPSMMMLIHKICIAFNGFGIPIKVARVMRERAAIDVLNWNRTKLRML